MRKLAHAGVAALLSTTTRFYIHHQKVFKIPPSPTRRLDQRKQWESGVFGFDAKVEGKGKKRKDGITIQQTKTI